MSEDKVTTAKRTTKKAVADAAAKPKKAATATKAATAATTKMAVAKPAAAKRTTKTAADTVAAKPKKAASTTKAAGASKPKAAKPNGEAKDLIKRPPAPSWEERQNWIATAAYHRAEKRGFVPGYEEQDWRDAEAEIDALIGKG